MVLDRGKNGKLVIYPGHIMIRFLARTRRRLRVGMACIQAVTSIVVYPASVVMAGCRHIHSNRSKIEVSPSCFATASLSRTDILHKFNAGACRRFLPLFSNIPCEFITATAPSPGECGRLVRCTNCLNIVSAKRTLAQFFRQSDAGTGGLALCPRGRGRF